MKYQTTLLFNNGCTLALYSDEIPSIETIETIEKPVKQIIEKITFSKKDVRARLGASFIDFTGIIAVNIIDTENCKDLRWTQTMGDFTLSNNK